MEEQRGRGEGGQVLPLTLLVVVLAAVITIAIGRLGNDAVESARATTAADAAALAGVIDGDGAARKVAEANGAQLLRFERLPNGDIRVVVRHGRTEASARARASARPPVRFGGL